MIRRTKRKVLLKTMRKAMKMKIIMKIILIKKKIIWAKIIVKTITWVKKS